MEKRPGYEAHRITDTEVRYCVGVFQPGRWVTWRMDQEHHGYGSERYFATLEAAMADVVRRCAFHLEVIGAR